MRNPEDDRPHPDDDVTASEAASYAFCAKAWHLERVLGRMASPRAVARRERGTRQHEQQGDALTAVTTRPARRLVIVLGLALLLLVMLAVTVLLMWRA